MMIEITVDLVQDKTIMTGIMTGLLQDMVMVMSNQNLGKCPKIRIVDLDHRKDMKIHIIIDRGQDKDMAIDMICLVMDKAIFIQKVGISKGHLMKADAIGQVLDKVTMSLRIDQGHDKNMTIGQGHDRIMRTGLLVVAEIMGPLVTATIDIAMQIHTRDQVQTKSFLMNIVIYVRLVGSQMNLSTGHDMMHQMKDMIEHPGAVARMIQVILDIDLVRDTGKKNIAGQDPVEVRYHFLMQNM